MSSQTACHACEPADNLVYCLTTKCKAELQEVVNAFVTAIVYIGQDVFDYHSIHYMYQAGICSDKKTKKVLRFWLSTAISWVTALYLSPAASVLLRFRVRTGVCKCNS